MGHFIFKFILTGLAILILAHYESWACSYPPGDPLAAQQQACDTQAGNVWSCQLNRCMVTQETLEAEEINEACKGIEDRELQRECRVNRARQLVEQRRGVELDSEPGENEHPISHLIGQGVHGAIGSYYILLGRLGSESGCSPSSVFMNLAALTSITGSLLATHKQESQSRKYLEEYENLVSGERPVAAQVEAFDYLIKGQELQAESADAFKHANWAAGGLFAAAALQGLWGVMGGASFFGCSTSHFFHPEITPFPVAMVSEGLGEFFLSSFFPQAWAGQAGYGRMGVASATGGAAGGLVALLVSSKGKNLPGVDRLLRSPGGQFLLATAASSLAFYVANQYKKEAELVRQRAEQIKEVRDAFVQRVGYNSCPKSDDPRIPDCFCFIGPNRLNLARKSSGACKRYYPSSEGGEEPAPLPVVSQSPRAPSGCMDARGNFDLNCNCLKKNRCSRVKLDLGKMGFGSMTPTVGSLLKGSHDLFSGSGIGGSIQGDTVGQGAARLRRALEKALGDEKIKNSKEGKKLLAQLRGGMGHGKSLRTIRRALGSSGRALADSFRGMATSPAKSSPQNVLPQEVLKELRGRGVLFSKGIKKKKSPHPSIDALLGLEGKGRLPTQEKQKTSGYSEQNEYDYSGSDVYQGDHSIWKIISHRYNQTGLFHLFKK